MTKQELIIDLVSIGFSTQDEVYWRGSIEQLKTLLPQVKGGREKVIIRISGNRDAFYQPVSNFSSDTLVLSDTLPRTRALYGSYCFSGSVYLSIRGRNLWINPATFYSEVPQHRMLRQDLWWSNQSAISHEQAVLAYEIEDDMQPIVIVNSSGQGVLGYFLEGLTPKSEPIVSGIDCLSQLNKKSREIVTQWEARGEVFSVTEQDSNLLSLGVTPYPVIKMWEFRIMLLKYVRDNGGVEFDKGVLTNMPMEHWLSQEEFCVKLIREFPIFQPIFELMASSITFRERVVTAYIADKLASEA